MTAAGMKQDTGHLTEVHGTSGSEGDFAVRLEGEGFYEPVAISQRRVF